MFLTPENAANVLDWVVFSDTANQITVDSNGIVNYDYGYVTANTTSGDTTIGPNQWANLGLLIEPPGKDRIPYRVQASVNSKAAVVLGYAPVTIAAGDIAISLPRYIPFVGTFDGLITVEPADIYAGRALYIGVATAEQVTNGNLAGYVSAQNLGVKPPTMQNAIS